MEVSIFDLVVGDVIPLKIGDQVNGISFCILFAVVKVNFYSIDFHVEIVVPGPS